eukprot:5409032-Ditylum_brightwellii.AAC.1
MPTSCPMGILDVFCLDDEDAIPPTFTQMMRSVPKGRAIVLSGFYGETTSSKCKGENAWGLTLLDSERLVTELGHNTLPQLADQ